MKTCCFTGHRNLTEEQRCNVAVDLSWWINMLIQNSYTHFISGMANGSDILAAQVTGSFRHKNEAIILEAAVPYRCRLFSKKENFQYVLKLCNQVTVIQEQYSPGCFQKRNKYMVDKSDIVIAIWDGRTSGGTYNTIRYAKSLGKDIIQIHPL